MYVFGYLDHLANPSASEKARDTKTDETSDALCDDPQTGNPTLNQNPYETLYPDLYGSSILIVSVVKESWE